MDVTGRKQTEAALWDSEDRYRTLFDLCPVAVYSCDASGVIEKFNRRAMELWGREPAPRDTDERFCGSFKLFRPDGSFMPHDQCPMAEVVGGKLGQVCDGEVLIGRPDGSRVTVIVNIRPLKNEEGEVTGAINCFYDITERKQAEEQLQTARSTSERMGHELVITLPSEPIWVNVDPLRLAQVVGNLLDNASKFTEKGGRIRLSVELEHEKGVIRVRDNGIGIAADQLPLICDMFVQADVSIERTSSGLGLGLALVKKLVEGHDGTVEAHSAGLGQGSEFVVRLPVTVAPETQLAGTRVSETENTTVRRVLVVDDNRDAAESLAMLLKLASHEAHIAHDGLEAVETATQVRPDLILLDIGLPKINGYEAARRIRNEPWGKTVALVALTGWGQDDDRRKSREAGFDGHLLKPVNPDVLTKLLAEFPSVESVR